MKFIKLIFVLTLAVFSCKNDTKKGHVESIDHKKEILDLSTRTYPESLLKVFEAHGGLD